MIAPAHWILAAAPAPMISHALYLTFAFSLLAPMAHAWGCWRYGDFPRVPPLGAGLAAAAMLNAVLVTAYRGDPVVIGLALPSLLYLVYLRLSPWEPLPDRMPVVEGGKLPVKIPDLRLPAIIAINGGTGEAYSRMEFAVFEALEQEFTGLGISVAVIVPDAPAELERFRKSNGISCRMISDPHRELIRALGCSMDEPPENARAASFFVDSDGTVRIARYSNHPCERLGLEGTVELLEKKCGIRLPDRPEPGTAGEPA